MRMSSSRPTVAYLLLAVWFGFLTGTGELALAAVNRYGRHHMVGLGPHAVWMTLAANIGWLALVGCALSLLARRWPRLASGQMAVCAYALVGSFSVLVRCPGLHPVFALVLAVGLSVQAGRAFGAHPQRWYRLAGLCSGWTTLLRRRKSTDLLPGRRQVLASSGATLAGLAAGTWGWTACRCCAARAALPPAPDLPNVLLIVLDTVRASSLSLYGHTRLTTPWLSRLAATGVTFDRCWRPLPGRRHRMQACSPAGSPTSCRTTGMRRCRPFIRRWRKCSAVGATSVPASWPTSSIAATRPA